MNGVFPYTEHQAHGGGASQLCFVFIILHMTFKAVVIRLGMAHLARKGIAMNVMHLQLRLSWTLIIMAIVTAGEFCFGPHTVIHLTRTMKIVGGVAVHTGHPHFKVNISTKTDGPHELSGISGTVASEAGLIHGWSTEKGVLINEPAGENLRSAYVAIATGGVAGNAVLVKNFIVMGRI